MHDHLDPGGGRSERARNTDYHPRNCVALPFTQDVMVLFDLSGSMRNGKLRQALSGCLDLVRELAKPENNHSFSIAMIPFGSCARISRTLHEAALLSTQLTTLESLRSFLVAGTPVGFEKRTNITAALTAARALLRQPSNLSLGQSVAALRPVFILQSDGRHNCGPRPERIAELVKEQADLVTVAYGKDADETLLTTLATTPQHFYRCATGSVLRRLLAKIGSTLSHSIAQHKDSTHALASLRIQ